MDVVKTALGNRARAVTLPNAVVILLDSHLITRNLGDPGNMAPSSCIALGDAARNGLVVDNNASLACSIIPRVGIAPGGTLISVVELEAESLVDTPSDEASALALVVVPWINAAALALVGVVVRDRTGDAAAWGLRAARALLRDVAVGASFDVVVRYVAAVGGLIPDVVPVDAGSGGLARNVHLLALLICELHTITGTGSSAAVDGVASDGVGRIGEREKTEDKGDENSRFHGEHVEGNL